MKIGQNSAKHCKIKRNSVEVFYNDKSNVFYVKTSTKHNLNQGFKPLINCDDKLFNEFLSHLKSSSSGPVKLYSFHELEKELNKFLINRSMNCKPINYENVG